MSKSYKEIDWATRVLGLGEEASLKKIMMAFRSQAKKWHPDKCKKKDKEACHEKMKEINRAYKIIMKYIEDYSYSFKREKIAEDDPMERWKQQFGGDPHWGPGWGKEK